MRVLVLGGYGAVGTPVVDELRAHGHTALAAGRDPTRADRPVDLREPGLRTYAAALDGIDVVVNTAGVEDPRLVSAAAERGTAFIDVSATAGYLGEVERLAPSAPVVLSVGLAPGLTTLLAADLHAARPDAPIDIAVLLGTGTRTGWRRASGSRACSGAGSPTPPQAPRSATSPGPVHSSYLVTRGAGSPAPTSPTSTC